MASERLQELLKGIHSSDNASSMSEPTVVEGLAATFSMAFSSNSAAVNPDIFNEWYCNRDGCTQQDACDFIREVLVLK